MKLFKTLSTALVIGSLILVLPACQPKEGPVERAGKEVDKAAEKVGDKMEKAGESVKDAVKK